MKGFIAVGNDTIRVESIAAVFEDRFGSQYAGKRKGTNILFTSGERAEYPEVFAYEVTNAMEAAE